MGLPFSLPSLGFSSTTSGGNLSGTTGGNTTGGITFGNRNDGSGIKTYLLFGAVAVAVYLIAKKVTK